MNQNRRNFLRRTSMMGASLAAAQSPQHEHGKPKPERPPASGASDESGFLPVITPDLPKLPFRLEGGVKVFELIAEPVRTEFLRASSWSEARVVDAWGYNGSVPGPTIEVREGDRVRIVFRNHLPEPTTPHWHGLEVPMDQDGVPGIGQPLIMPGETHIYEFTLRQNGTFFYHSHMPMQELLGMIGLFIVHPKRPHEPRVDKDFAFILQGWAILPNNTIPNTMAMEFNWLTMNGKSGPDTTPMIIRQGEHIRMRFVNLSMDHHPIHMHGHQFYVTGTEGGRIPASAWYPGNTVIVGVAQARDVELVAQHEGDWMVHCHLPHHMMNQMVSMVGPMNHLAHAAPSTPSGPEAHADHAHSARRPPGFPQDMWMTMDAEVARPETSWLPEGWTGAMMGMMTLARILPSEKYERMMSLIRERRYEPGPKWPAKETTRRRS
ncbi:MAG: copper oxidase [Blastocatellia bacterium]|nr:copper oxidase [Blastocatellia bacterium]